MKIDPMNEFKKNRKNDFKIRKNKSKNDCSR